MHYLVHKRCNVSHATLLPGQMILEGDMPRDALLPALAAGDVQQFGEIDTSPYVAPPTPVIPAPTPLDQPTEGHSA